MCGDYFHCDEDSLEIDTENQKESLKESDGQVFVVDLSECECGIELNEKVIRLDILVLRQTYTDIEHKSVTFSMFDISSYEGECFETSLKDFPVIIHDELIEKHPFLPKLSI